MSTPQMQRTVPELIGNIVDNVQQIIRSEFRLAKAELQEKASRASKPATTVGAGFLLGLHGLGFLLLAAVYALSMIMAAGLAALIVGGVLALVSIVLVTSSTKKTQSLESGTRKNNSDRTGECPMGERPDQIERQIAATRSALSDNFSELQDKVKSAVDWRTQFQEHPGTLLAVAFGGGVVLSALLPSPRRSRKTYDWGSISVADRTHSAPSYDSSATPSKPSDLRKTIEALTGALLGVAVNQASGFLDSVLPGFHQEFTKARAGKDRDSRRDNSPIDASADSDTKDSTSPKPLTTGASA
jgi:ElaB/YqjD/DUF883 family membrane-anchored ribosome-binding protein